MGAFDGLGIAQGLGALGNGLSGGYYGAMGTAFNRNLQTQAAQSEANLKNAQAQYFGGRNGTMQGVADTRAQGVLGAAGLRTQAQQNIASLMALGKLPANIAGQDPYTARAMIHQFDALNPNGNMEQSIYGSSMEGLPGMDGAAMGTPGMGAPQPGMAPAAPSAGPPPLMPSTPPGMPPGPMTPGAGPPPPMAPQGPGMPPLMSSPPPGMPQGPGMAPQGPGAPPQGPGAPPQGPGVPQGPMRNPFNVPPLTAARAANLTASGDLMAIKANLLPQLTLSQIQDNLANAGLRGSQGKFYDARTNEVVPMAQAKIALDNAQAGRANMDTQTLPGFRQGLIQNGATTAGANALRANTYSQVAPIDANANATRANSGADYQAGRLGIDQQNANTNAQRAGGGAKGLLPNGYNAAQDDALAKESLGNVQNAARIQHMINTGLAADGKTNLSPAEKQMYSQQVQSLQQRNAEINRRRGAGTEGQAPSSPGAYSGPVPRSQADFQAMPAAQKAAYIMSLRHQNGH